MHSTFRSTSSSRSIAPSSASSITEIKMSLPLAIHHLTNVSGRKAPNLTWRTLERQQQEQLRWMLLWTMVYVNTSDEVGGWGWASGRWCNDYLEKFLNFFFSKCHFNFFSGCTKFMLSPERMDRRHLVTARSTNSQRQNNKKKKCSICVGV